MVPALTVCTIKNTEMHVLTQEQWQDEVNIVPADSRGISAPTGVVRCYHKHKLLLKQCGDKTYIMLTHSWTVNTIARLRPKSPQNLVCIRKSSN